MKITRRDIANYRLLGILLDKDRRKLQKYVEKRPSCYSGKVYGSNPQFPYEREDSPFVVAQNMNR